MRSHKILEHTADVRLHVEGGTEEELFTAALEGMGGIIKKEACRSSPDMTETVSVSSATPTLLLIDFLSEILTLSHINHTVFCGVEFEKLDNASLKAKIRGVKVEEFDEDIKAVTYHEADVKKNEKGNFETIIVFDI